MRPFAPAALAGLVAVGLYGSDKNGGWQVSGFSSSAALSRSPLSSPSSFVVKQSPRPFALQRPSYSRRPLWAGASSGMQMLVQPSGQDALKEIASSDSPYSKTVRKTPHNVRKFASIVTIPAAAITGFIMTPSNRVIANGVGGAIAGVVGGIGKSRLDLENVAAAKPALAQLLLDSDLADASLPDKVQQLKTEYGVLDDDFMDMATDVYRRYLMAMVKHPMTKTAEITELTNLRNALGLDNIAVGEAHATAAAEFYAETCRWTPEEELDDPEHPDRMSLDKFLFLSERAFRHNGETPEAFTFEFGRVAKAFHTEANMALRRVADVAEPFYQRALDTTRAKLDSGVVSSDMLARARSTLGIADEVAKDMHISTYSDEVRSLLGMETEGVDPATCVFPQGALDRLEILRSVLDVSEKDAQYEQSVEVTPLFQATAVQILKDATAQVVGNATTTTTEAAPDMAGLWQQIMARKDELCLTDESMKPLLDSVVIQTLGTPLEEASTFAGVNNEAGVYEKLQVAVQIKDTVSELLQQGGAEDDIERFYDMDSSASAFAFISLDMRKNLYQLFQTRAIKEGGTSEDDTGGLSEAMHEELRKVQNVLGVDDDTANDVTTIVCGPLLEKTLKATANEITEADEIEDGMVEEKRTKIQNLIAELKVPEPLVKRYTTEIYKNFIRFVQQNSPSGIPQAEYSEKLDVLQDLFGLGEEDTSPLHAALFGSTYKKSVLESMGSTGIILPEYRNALDTLRKRLGLGEDAAKEMFHKAVAEKILPMVKRVEIELERTLLTKEQLSQKRGKDMGEDFFKGGMGSVGSLGIGTQGNVMGDIMTLVDFYTENDFIEKKKVEGSDEGEEGEEEYEDFFPVTAVREKAVEPEMAEAMYRQFVVGCFTTQGQQAERYEKAAPIFGGILGLNNHAMEEIGGSVGGTVYENFMADAMNKKTALDQQDMMFLANIQQRLRLSSEKAEEMLVDAQKKVLRERAQRLFEAEKVFAPDIKGFRERCNSAGLDPYTDLQLPKDRIAALMVVELSEGIEKGQVTPESVYYLTEVQESLGMSEEDCESTLESMVQSRISNSIDIIGRYIKDRKDASCVDEIKRILKFAAFVDGDVDLEVKKATADKMMNIFGASDFGSTPQEEVDAQMDLLRRTLGLA